MSEKREACPLTKSNISPVNDSRTGILPAGQGSQTGLLCHTYRIRFRGISAMDWISRERNRDGRVCFSHPKKKKICFFLPPAPRPRHHRTRLQDPLCHSAGWRAGDTPLIYPLYPVTNPLHIYPYRENICRNNPSGIYVERMKNGKNPRY